MTLEALQKAKTIEHDMEIFKEIMKLFEELNDYNSFNPIYANHKGIFVAIGEEQDRLAKELETL